MPSGHFTTDHPSLCAQVTGSGSDPENMETGTQAPQSTKTSPTLVSGPGEKNYPWEPRLEGLILVANLWTKMGRGRCKPLYTAPSCQPCPAQVFCNETNHARIPSGPGPWVLTVGEAEMA